MFNAVQCQCCLKVLISISRHDFKQCGCENETFVDGGGHYCRMGGKDLSKVKPITKEEYNKIKEEEIKYPRTAE